MEDCFIYFMLLEDFNCFLPKKNTFLIVTQLKVKSKIFATAYTTEQDVYGFSLRTLHTVINMPLIFTCCCSKYKHMLDFQKADVFSYTWHKMCFFVINSSKM